MTQLDLVEQPRREPEHYVAEAIACEGCPLKTVCLLSGGGDSTVTAHRCRDLYTELAFIDTGTALPGVREFVVSFAASLGKPLRILDSGDAYRRLVLGDDAWWRFYRRERRRGESLSDFVVRTTPGRRRGDGLGNAPQGFPGPVGGHRAAYARLKERQIEALVRDAKTGRGRFDRVALLCGARRSPERCSSAAGSLVGMPCECNCGAYMSTGELADVVAFFPDWHDAVIRPLEEEALEAGIPRSVWGERTDTGRVGARGYPFDEVGVDQLALAFDQGVPDVSDAGELCSSCGHGDLVAERRGMTSAPIDRLLDDR